MFLYHGYQEALRVSIALPRGHHTVSLVYFVDPQQRVKTFMFEGFPYQRFVTEKLPQITLLDGPIGL